MRHKLALALATVIPVAGIATYAYAKRVVGDFESMPPSFQLLGRPLGGNSPANATAANLSGSRISAAGDGALVIDSDSGSLLKRSGYRALTQLIQAAWYGNSLSWPSIGYAGPPAVG